ncbi:MAG: 4-(cytidine 5'-diphospho)-2-C-methyl-D-erythritol kinase [Steroidobacteraceae bacterium]|nr:4-(cytidine 5'-diphospho)-2-C-methyl-D-erythritol kinase [Steroidobacteraceae bacterium]MBP7012777.1 4-(cytidine 5'-diphospho)-2-C-methyl-D-erythritol kinase [Steroidobacteraceae bacterium]
MNRPLGHPASWPAPGKLNLFLHVVGHRPDGYHELQTAFQFIDLCDSIRFYQRPPGVIERLSALPGVGAEDDLVVRAARRLAAAAVENGAAPRQGVAIELAKNLPMGGGVGGGSSDAATVLVALNHLWEIGFDNERLAELGLKLGADVPVFVHGHAAWAEGVGERLVPVDFPEPVYLLLQPEVAISTAEVFKAPELTRDSPVITIAGFLQTGGRNDCEPVVRRRYPVVAGALDWLGRHGPARLTGTGSCVFAPMTDAMHAAAVLADKPGEWRGWVAHGLNQSPLTARLQFERQFGPG